MIFLIYTITKIQFNKVYIKLFENFVDLSKNSTLTKKQILEIIEENCSDFKWSDRPIYRSIKSNQLYLYQNAWDHPKTYTHDDVEYRMSMQSTSTKNYSYTLLMNHLDCWKGYPKRQLICSTSMRHFKRGENLLFRVIPFNGSKWGVVPHFDIHNTLLDNELSKNLSELLTNEFKVVVTIQKLMDLVLIGIPQSLSVPIIPKHILTNGKTKPINSWSDLLEFCSKVDTSTDTWTFSDNPKQPLAIEMLNRSFSPGSMNFKKMTYSEYINSKLPDYVYNDYWSGTKTEYTDSDKIYDVKNPDPGHEIWTDSNVLLINSCGKKGCNCQSRGPFEV